MDLRLPELRRTAHRKEEFLYYLFIHKGLSASLSNCAYLLLESHPHLPRLQPAPGCAYTFIGTSSFSQWSCSRFCGFGRWVSRFGSWFSDRCSRWGRGSADTRRAPHCPNLPCRLPAPPARQLSKSFDASSHELDLNQYQATCLLVDREWVHRPP